jgi:hypothetical protein
MIVAPDRMMVESGASLFHMSMNSFVRESLRLFHASLAHTNLAIREGKALELLRELVVGFYGMKDMKVEESGRDHVSGATNIWLIAGQSPTHEEEAMVRLRFAEINRRYGTKFRPFILNEDKGGIKEVPEDVKRS